MLGYIDGLISEKTIPSREGALGLYIVGRLDPDIRQLNNAIVAERLTSQLRLIAAESLLSLAEVMSEYDVSHDDILAILRPSGPAIDSVVDLLTRLVGQRPPDAPPSPERTQSWPEPESAVSYWLTPVRSDQEVSAEDEIVKLVGRDRAYAFGERTPGRSHMKPGDLICFYATTKGVVAHARLDSAPTRQVHPHVRHPDKYPWVVALRDIKVYVNDPLVIDSTVRAELEEFQGRDLAAPWAWFVQATRKLSVHDFQRLTRQEAGADANSPTARS